MFTSTPAIWIELGGIVLPCPTQEYRLVLRSSRFRPPSVHGPKKGLTVRTELSLSPTMPHGTRLCYTSESPQDSQIDNMGMSGS